MNKVFPPFFIFITILVFICGCSRSSTEKTELKITNNADSLDVLIDTSSIIHIFTIENDSLVGIKFNVDDVLKNSNLLKTYSATDAIANFIGKKLTFSPDSISNQLVAVHGNGLMHTIYLCYAQHRPLVLSPDIIWMTIAQGASTHINQEFKTLEKKLFVAGKPKILEVRNDSLDFGAKYWQQLIESLTDLTRKYTQKEMYSFMAPKFSTTTQQIYTAYEANILYAYKKAFTYVGGNGCGIPYITITGSKKDWMQIKEKLNILDFIGLGYWRKELEPIIDKFINLYSGNYNNLFWKNIYKEYTDYGEYEVSGWIIKFFPYKEVLRNGADEETGMYRLEHVFEKNEFLEGDKYLYSTLDISDFPTYKSEAPIIYKNYFKNETTNMFLYSGIMAAKQYPDGSLKPWITWAICSENEPKAKELLGNYQEMVHQDPEWIPFIYNVDSLLDIKPIYAKRKGMSYEESISEFKNDLQDFLGSKNNYQNDTLTFYILANGKPLFFSKNSKPNGKQKDVSKIQDWLDKKGVRWQPAQKKLVNIMETNEPTDLNTLVKVNCRIEIVID